MKADNIIKCPHCGKCHYTENYTTATAMGWTTVVKDGVRYSEDPNIYTTFCTCLECGSTFSFDNKGNISLGTVKENVEENDTENILSLNYNQDITGDHNFTSSYSFDYSNLINNDGWKNYQSKWVITDNVENILIVYKGVTYKFNLQKMLDKLADIVEEVTVINK